MSEQLPSEIEPYEWLKINQFVLEMKKIDSPCITVYYPYGKGKDTISLLQNTKRKEAFEEIESQVEKRIEQMQKNPKSVGRFAKTVCIFGWIHKGRVQIKDITTSKKLPYIYMENKRPYLKPFQDILKINYNVLFVILDQKSAKIQKFQGSKIIKEAKLSIDLQGRHKKGGQSQGRFLRARQTKIHVFYKKIAKKIREMDSDSEIILLGGSGPAKTDFHSELDLERMKKCHFVQDVSFSTTKEKIHKKMIQYLYQFRRKQVSEKMQKYEKLVKEGLTAKKNSVIYEALKDGAVDTLIVSAEYHKTAQFKKIMKMLEIAKKTSASIEFVSSPKFVKRLSMNESVLAILRYKIK